MTTDVIALCRTRPEGEAQVAALQAAGPDFRVASWHDTPVILLLDENERVVLAVDGARLLQVPGEVRRLLGPSAPTSARRSGGSRSGRRRRTRVPLRRLGGWPAPWSSTTAARSGRPRPSDDRAAERGSRTGRR